MKRSNNFIRRSVLALLAGLVLMTAFGAQTAQAQDREGIRPFLDCVEQEYSGGVETGKYIAYFGYSNDTTETPTYTPGGQNNFFTNDTERGENEFRVFKPGVHPRVELVKVPIGSEVSWYLGTGAATASFTNSQLCAADGVNSRLMTYQGKLSDGAQAANGAYDLQFQLFNQLTGGEARTTKITLDNVPVTNGVFTVQLDLGANALQDGGLATSNLKLNPAILDAENSFFEIGVRPGTSTGAYTTLTPRQPITAVPLAMRANTANNAFRAANADKFDGRTADQFVQINNRNFSITGSGTISGSTEYILNLKSSSSVGTWLTLDNTSTGGRQWSIVSTGANNGEGAGKLLFYDLTNSTGRLLLSDAGANITGNLTVSGAISGTVSNATNATNAAQLGGVAANQYLTTTNANSTLIQNTTTQQTGNFNISGSGTVGGNLTVGGTINGTVSNATNAAQLGGVAASQYLTTTSANSNLIQNTTTQQTNSNFNISGNGTIGGTLTANTTNISGTLTATTTNIGGTIDRLLNVQSSSSIGTWLTLNNTTTGGRQWSVISTGAENGEGAGKLLFYDLTNATGRLLLDDDGASINGNLTVSGAINGTVSNATNAANATNATNVSGGFVQLPLTTGAPPAAECDEASEYGRQKVDAANVRLYICTAAGWKSTVLQ